MSDKALDEAIDGLKAMQKYLYGDPKPKLQISELVKKLEDDKAKAIHIAGSVLATLKVNLEKNNIHCVDRQGFVDLLAKYQAQLNEL